MQLQELLSDDDAVSPVIGVILMVAITVILAAVIGAFVLGLGNNQNVAPQVSFEYSGDNSGLDITHVSGDSFQADNVEFSGEAMSNGDVDWSNADGDNEGTITAGDGVSLADDEVDQGTLRVLWSDSGDDEQTQISTHEVPGS
jgi:flagellin-like protein